MSAISLLYHDVVNGDPSASGFQGAHADSYKLDVANFLAHLDSIAAAGVSRVRLTFDDGAPDL